MATNFRDVLNRCLRVLGEDEISSSVSELTEDYHKILAEFVNIIKEEVEEAHHWRALRQQDSATVSADAISGTITNATERSRLVRIHDQRLYHLVPLVYDITDTSNPSRLQEMDLPMLIDRDNMDPDQRATDDPTFFALDNSAGDALAVYVWPRPSTSRTIRLYLTTPQARLADTDLDTTISIPTRPIVAGALWYALEERGEELGTSGLFNEQRYRLAVDDAIARDAAEGGDAFELVSV